MRLLAAVLTLGALGAQEAPKPAAGAGLAPAVCADAEIGEFGLECTAEEPCPVFLELSGVEAAGAKIFVTGNLHTATATLWSLLAVSEDGGKTWSEPQTRLRGAALDLIQFVDAETGWVAGQIAGAMPKDPFFLKTTDGGKTWRRTPVFEESSYGVVEQFQFQTKTEGWLVVNRRGAGNQRYQKMDTMTGGDSWMLKEASATPVAGGKARTAEWRVRVDGAAKLHRVERRQDGRWTAVASFALHGGECKPAPPKPAEAVKEPGGN
jgi:hypothetical protein